MSEQAYKSVAEIPSLGIPEYAEPERIFLRMGTIRRLAALAGYHGEVTITGHAGDPTEQSIAIGGVITGGGGAAAASASLVRVHRASPGKTQHDAEHPDTHHRGALTLSVNTARVREGVEGHVRQPEAWAGALHTAIGGTLVKAAWEHFVGDNLSRDKMPSAEVGYETSFHTGVQGIATPILMLQEVSALQSLGWRALAYGVVLSLCNMNRMSDLVDDGYSGREACFSLLPVMHLDRVARVWAGSRLRRLTEVAPAV